MPTFRVFFTTFFLLSAPLACLSAEIQLGAGFQNVKVHEVDTEGKTLDTETGNLPFLMANFNFSLMSGWSLINENQLSIGNLDYDGQLQNGTPYKTKTDTVFRIHSLSIQTPNISSWLDGKQKISATLGYHFWRRHIKGKDNVSDLNEDYNWKTLGIGLSHTNQNKDIVIKASIHQSFDGQMEADIPNFGSGTLSLPNGIEYRLNGEYQLSKNRNFSSHLGMSYSYLNVPRSSSSGLYKNHTKVATAVEPEHSLQTISAYFALTF